MVGKGAILAAWSLAPPPPGILGTHWTHHRESANHLPMLPTMLQTIKLENFRCFSSHEVHFRPTTIVVGRNNAGKSTLVEALRLVSIVTARYRNLTYGTVPEWFDMPARRRAQARAVFPSLRGAEINLENVFHRYGEPPASITAAFSDNKQVVVQVGPDGEVAALIEDADGRPVTSRSQAIRLSLPQVSTNPQVAPLSKEEKVLSGDYVRSSLDSTLAPQHFRNQLYHFPDLLEEFCGTVEETWPGVRIRDLEVGGDLPNRWLSLLVQDQDFVAEAAWMGHGLQMWLQTMWYLCRASEHQSIILDEPDVYMHADLQRRIIRLLRRRDSQVIVATHSLEIISEVEPEEILVVDRFKSRSAFAESLPSVQRVVSRVGGVQNIALTRLWSANRCLLLEGKDLEILEPLYDKLFPESDFGLGALPSVSIGGWGGWNYAVGSSMLLRNAAGGAVVVFCILDSDYHTENEIRQRQKEATDAGVRLHIWNQKELENYVIDEVAIRRVISKRVAKRTSVPTIDEIAEKIDEIVNDFRDEIQDAIATEALAQNRAGGVAKANRYARDVVTNAWKSSYGKRSMVSGKQLLARINSWSQEEFGVSFSTRALAREFRPEEVPAEVREVLSDIYWG